MMLSTMRTFLARTRRAENRAQNPAENLARNGASAPPARNPYAAHMQRYVLVLRVVSGRSGVAGVIVRHARGPRFCSLGLRLRDPLHLDRALKLAEPVALAAGVPAVMAARREDAPGLVTFQFELKRGLWKSYTRGQLAGLEIGVGEANRPLPFTFEHNPHAGVFGTTNSGKTETTRTILHALASTYDPASMRLAIVDRHHDFDDFCRLQHLALPVAHDDVATDQVLDWVGQTLAHRIATNQRATQSDVPAIVLVIDEAEDILGDVRRFAIVQKIGKEARKFGIHLVMATQKPNQTKLPDLLPNVLNRYVGLVDDAHTSARLTGKPGLNCHQLTGKGDFLHVEGPTAERLQVALTTARDLEALPWGDEPPMPDVEAADTPRLLNMPDAQPGRPPNELQPDVTALYLAVLADDKEISIRSAREELGVSRGLHEMHKPFARDILYELGRLGYGIVRS